MLGLYDSVLHANVAMKRLVLPADSRVKHAYARMVHREVSILRQLNAGMHPNIISLMGVNFTM